MTTAPPRDPIALTVIGGFLGAGKTTLLNALLREAGDRRLAVLVNDFGAINIDAELVQSREGAMISLKNGCICCGVSGDFIGELALLRDRRDPPEHVVVEASGVADPGAIVALGDMPGYRRDAAVIVADAETVRGRAADEATGPMVRRQLRAADLIVLNKTDLVTGEDLAATHAWLREVAGPSTAVVEASFGAVAVDVALGSRPTVQRPREDGEGCGAYAGHDGDEHDHAGHDHAEHDHTPHPAFETWSWSGPRPLSGAGLVAELKALPDGIVRAKGLLHLLEDLERRYVLQLVGRRYSIEADRPWGDATPASQLVVIGLPGSVDVDGLTARFERLVAAPGA
ncbi:MAG: GTP-binding protein [Actinomycetota bacterium]|nr:GTP-binding protein [Actinomycetota bacterium]